MAHFIDRRLNGKNKSTVNRQRFLRRHKQQIKESIADAVNKRSITDVESGENITIPSRDIKEPSFHQGRGGQREVVHPATTNSLQVTALNAPKEGRDKAGQEKVKPAKTVKAKMNLYSKFPKMSTSIYCLKIWSYLT